MSELFSPFMMIIISMTTYLCTRERWKLIFLRWGLKSGGLYPKKYPFYRMAKKKAFSVIVLNALILSHFWLFWKYKNISKTLG
jgi:positive regulator of sigma E activity